MLQNTFPQTTHEFRHYTQNCNIFTFFFWSREVYSSCDVQKRHARWFYTDELSALICTTSRASCDGSGIEVSTVFMYQGFVGYPLNDWCWCKLQIPLYFCFNTFNNYEFRKNLHIYAACEINSNCIFTWFKTRIYRLYIEKNMKRTFTSWYNCYKELLS